jgi:hypothetical protein
MIPETAAHDTQEPALTVYLMPLAELVLPPAPRPDEVSARLAAAAARRKLAARRKSSTAARDRQKARYAAAAASPPAPMPLPAPRKPTQLAPVVEVPDTCDQPLEGHQAWPERASWWGTYRSG